MTTVQLDMREATNYDLSWISGFIHNQMVCVMGITPASFSYSIEVTYSETEKQMDKAIDAAREEK